MSAFIGPNNEYPRYAGDIALAHPEWDGNLEELPAGWFLVEPTSMPAVGPDEMPYEVAPVKANGKYVAKWEIRPLTEHEIFQRNLHAARMKVMNFQAVTEAEAALLMSPDAHKGQA